MKNKTFKIYYILSLIGTLILSFYPLYMGVKVVTEMIANGVVQGEDYPKYIIPYTPISFAVITGVLLMPLLFKKGKKYTFLFATIISLSVFFATELLIENMVIVEKYLLSDWQMYSCVFRETELVKVNAWEILVGDYSPWFKLHFYLISVAIILSLLNCFYGFGQMIQSNDKTKLKTLIFQAVASVLFLGLCILACFPAFFRTGTLYISTLSAFLMATFFIVFGVTMGIFAGSFLHRKNLLISVTVPTVVAIITTTLMYIGEMILLSGEVYRFGISHLCSGLGKLILAPIDIIIIFLSGCITMLIMSIVVMKRKVDEADYIEDKELYDY